MKIPGLRNGIEPVGGLVYFGRMLDKIRLHAAGKLPEDYNRGTGFDARICEVLGVTYDALAARTLEGGTDEDVLAWCRQTGSNPTGIQVEMFNDWITKRGWRDGRTASLAKMKAERGWASRDEIVTYFDFHRADESD